MKAKLTALMIVLAGWLPCPVVAKNASFVESLDTFFGKTEAQLQEKFGKPQKVEKISCLPHHKYFTFASSAGPGAVDQGNAMSVSITTEDGIVTSVWFHYSHPERERIDLLSTLGRSSVTAAATARNFLFDKTRALSRPHGYLHPAVMLNGASDPERWALVKNNLMRLDSMDDQQVQAIFGEGCRRGEPAEKNYSHFCKYYQITPYKRVPGSKLSRAYRLELFFYDGTVGSTRIERDEWDLTRVVFINQNLPGNKRTSGK